MHYPDLSSYEYDLPRPLDGVLNVGWLERTHLFPVGKVPPLFQECLKKWLVAAKVNTMRGYQQCSLCTSSSRSSVMIAGDIWWLGAAEVWIPSTTGEIYAAPNLITHYVSAHSYLPPERFVEAVLNESMIEKWDAEAEFERRTVSLYL